MNLNKNLDETIAKLDEIARSYNEIERFYLNAIAQVQDKKKEIDTYRDHLEDLAFPNSEIRKAVENLRQNHAH